MIIGNGLLAQAFADRFRDDPGVIIFASGVSNSAEQGAVAFERERMLLEEALSLPVPRLVYFGSCSSCPAGPSEYLRHKHRMESMVATRETGLVLRLPQVVGRTRNPSTLTNFLHDRIHSSTPFALWSQAKRNLLDVDDLVAIATRIIETTKAGPAEHVVASRISHPIVEVVTMFEHVLGRTARYTSLPLGEALEVEANLAWAIAAELGIDLSDGYAESVIRKYYGSST